ncbi:MAG: PAS domain-containing sensor histidine kinase [Ktedonobacterales bacterium]|nr:PAS domain-containing sensor histidine kinase [Ktedonobacterales bacterium]
MLGDLFDSSSAAIPLDALGEFIDGTDKVDRLLLGLRETVLGAPFHRRARAACAALVKGLPADIACIFLERPTGLVYAGGIELQTDRAHPAQMVLRQPAQAMRHRLHRLATRARTHTDLRVFANTRPAARWLAHLAIPLTRDTAPLGWLVVGRHAEHFASEESEMLVVVAASLAALLAESDPTDPLATLPSETLHAVLQATDDAFLLIDERFTIRALNPAFYGLTGWDAAVVGRHCQEVIRCHDDERIPLCGTVLCPLHRATPPVLGALPRERVSIEGATVPSHAVTVAAVLLPSGANGERQSALLLRDDGAVAQQDREREQFLSAFEHKLLNRFNSIAGFVEMVASDPVHPVSAEQRQLLGYSHNSALELLEYIKNLLYLTRHDLGQTPLMLKSIAVRDLFEEVNQHLTLEMATHNVAILIDAEATLPTLHCERELLRQALMNLVTNAIKFSHAGGTVRLSADATPAALHLRIADEGIGIAPDDQPHIFARDYVSDRTARLSKNGGGMGLAAASAIVEQHAGTLTFTSTVGVGTIFTITLPLR